MPLFRVSRAFFHGQIPLRQYVQLTRNAKRGKYFPPIKGGGGGGKKSFAVRVSREKSYPQLNKIKLDGGGIILYSWDIKRKEIKCQI